MLQIVIAEDHTIVVEGIKSLLEKEEDIQIIKTFENGLSLIEYLKNHSIDLVIMDVMMPIMDGLEATAVIKKSYPKIKVLILSISHKPIHIHSALTAGVDGYLLKETSKEELVEAIHTLISGKKYFAQNVSNSLMTNSTYSISLTKRELEVLNHLSEGYSTKEIANKLSISVSTIKTYRNNLITKFDSKNTIGLIKKAINIGFI